MPQMHEEGRPNRDEGEHAMIAALAFLAGVVVGICGLAGGSLCVMSSRRPRPEERLGRPALGLAVTTTLSPSRRCWLSRSQGCTAAGSRSSGSRARHGGHDSHRGLAPLLARGPVRRPRRRAGRLGGGAVAAPDAVRAEEGDGPMSKASEWVGQDYEADRLKALRPVWELGEEPLPGNSGVISARVAHGSLGFEPILELRNGGTTTLLREQQAIAFARWILDTFGEHS